eukprot:158343_1
MNMLTLDMIAITCVQNRMAIIHLIGLMITHHYALSNLSTASLSMHEHFWQDHDFNQVYHMLQRGPLQLRNVVTNANTRSICFLNTAYQLLRHKMWIDPPFIDLVLGLLQVPVPQNQTDQIALKTLFKFGLTTINIYDATYPEDNINQWADSIKNALTAVLATKNEHANRLYSRIWYSEDVYVKCKGSTPKQVFQHVMFLVGEMQQIVPENTFKGFNVQQIYSRQKVETLPAILSRQFSENQCLKQILIVPKAPWTTIISYEQQFKNIDAFEITAIGIDVKMKESFGHSICGVKDNGQWYLIDDHIKSGPYGQTLIQFMGSGEMYSYLRKQADLPDIVSITIVNIAYDKQIG